TLDRARRETARAVHLECHAGRNTGDGRLADSLVSCGNESGVLHIRRFEVISRWLTVRPRYEPVLMPLRVGLSLWGCDLMRCPGGPDEIVTGVIAIAVNT